MKENIKLRESELKRMVAESVRRALMEHSRDIDDDNYFGGGLPNRYFDDDAFLLWPACRRLRCGNMRSLRTDCRT